MIGLPYLLAGGLALAAMGGVAGFKVASWRCDAARTEAVEAALRKGREQAEKANAEAAEYEAERAVADAAGAARQVEVREIYRTRLVRPDCALPADAAGVLERARLDANTAAAGESGRAVPADPPAAEPVGQP